MRSVRITGLALAAAALLAAGPAAGELGTVKGEPPSKQEIAAFEAYRTVVGKTARMVGDANARKLAGRHGLQVLNVTWEDTGRYKGSCVGPNISDMTIQVQQRDPRTGKYSLTCMPVIRFPNFSDKTGDISPESFCLLVGNQSW